MKKLNIILALIILAACGGGGGGGSEPAPIPTPAPTPAPTTVPVDVSNNWYEEFQFNFDNVATFGIGNNMPATQNASSQTPFNSTNNTNLSAYTSTGNEDLDAIITTEEYFVADVVYNDSLQRYWLISDPDIQASLTGSYPPEEGCSMIRVDLPNYGYQCVMPYSVGRAEPQLKRLSTSLDFSRRTLEFDPDNGSALFNAYVRRDFPDGILGGTNSSVTVFTDINGSYLATPDGFRNEAGVWMNNATFVTFDGPWFTNDGQLYNDEPYKYHFWSVGDEGASVSYTYDCTECNDLYNYLVESEGKVYTRGRIFSMSSSGTINIKDSAINIPMKGPNGKIWALKEEGTRWEIEEVLNDSINNSDSIKYIVNDQAIEIDLDRGSGIAPMQYNAINITDQYLMHVKTYPPENPISSIDGNANYLSESLNIGGYLLLFQQNQGWFFLAVPNELPSEEDLVISYKVNSESEDRTFTIAHETIKNFRESPWFEYSKEQAGNSDFGYFRVLLPEQHREGLCVNDFINNQNRCTALDGYDVFVTDNESYVFQFNFEKTQMYPNDSTDDPYDMFRRGLPGVQTLQLLEDKLMVYFKDSSNNNFYKGEAQIDDFLSNGLSSLTFTESSNAQGDQDLLVSLIKVD